MLRWLPFSPLTDYFWTRLALAGNFFSSGQHLYHLSIRHTYSVAHLKVVPLVCWAVNSCSSTAYSSSTAASLPTRLLLLIFPVAFHENQIKLTVYGKIWRQTRPQTSNWLQSTTILSLFMCFSVRIVFPLLNDIQKSKRLHFYKIQMKKCKIDAIYL